MTGESKKAAGPKARRTPQAAGEREAKVVAEITMGQRWFVLVHIKN